MGFQQAIGGIKHQARCFFSFLWRWELSIIGVTWSPPLVLYGRPFVSRFPGSVIKWGKSVQLNSSRRANPLGGEKPCILRTMSKQAQIILGDHVGLSNSTIVAGNQIEIGSHTILGAGCMILDNDFHALADDSTWRTEYVTNSRPIRIGQGCFLGARAMVLKGVVLGDHVVVGAGSVVTRNAPSRTLVAGNPAKVIRAF